MLNIYAAKRDVLKMSLWLVCWAVMLGNLLAPSAVATEQPIPESVDDKAQLLLHRIMTSKHLDISNSLDELVASVDDSATVENMERLHTLVDDYFYLDKYEELEKAARRLELVSVALSDSSHVGVARAYQIFAAGAQGDYVKAVSDLADQIAVSRIDNDHLVTVVATNLWASLMPFFGENNIAVANMIDAGRLIDQTEEQERLRLHLNISLAYLYAELNDLDGTLDHYLRSLEVAEAGDLKTDLGLLLYNAAMGMNSNHHHEMSIRFYEELSALYGELGQEESLLFSYYGLAANYFERDDYPNAWKYFELAVEYATESDDFRISLYRIGAEVAARLGRVEDAKRYGNKVKTFFQEHPDYAESTRALKSLRVDAEIARAEGRYLKAYDLLDRYHRANFEKTGNEVQIDIIKLRNRLQEIARLEQVKQKLIIRNSELTLRMFQIVIIAALIFFGFALIVLNAQRKSSTALRLSKAEAETANRAKTEFLANMSHELRTPLNAINGFSEIMKSEMFGPLGSQKYKEYADVIWRSGNHLLSVINDILDLSKVEVGKAELNECICEVETTIEDAIRVIETKANVRGVEIKCHVPKDFPNLFADQRILNQILYNALSNAVKFSYEGSIVTIEATLVGENDCICFEIVDRGLGMTEEEIQHVLLPFNQVQGSMTKMTDGTGLGLPLMAAFMELHRGEFKIESTKDVGTRVSFIFSGERSVYRHREPLLSSA